MRNHPPQRTVTDRRRSGGSDARGDVVVTSAVASRASIAVRTDLELAMTVDVETDAGDLGIFTRRMLQFWRFLDVFIIKIMICRESKVV